MSNNHRLSYRFLSLISLSLLITLCLGLPPAARALETAAQVVVVRGGVMVERDGASLSLKAKDPLYVSDTVRTNDGRVQIMFTDHSLVNLGSQTVFTVSEYRYQPESKEAALKTRIDEGVFRVVGGAVSKIAPKNFTTETPTATIGIRGSMYAGMLQDKELTVLFEGGLGIYVANLMGTVELNKPNLMTIVGEGQKPAPPKPALPGDIRKLYQSLTAVGGAEKNDGDGFAADGDGGGGALSASDGQTDGGNGGQATAAIAGAVTDSIQGSSANNSAAQAQEKVDSGETGSGVEVTPLTGKFLAWAYALDAKNESKQWLQWQGKSSLTDKGGTLFAGGMTPEGEANSWPLAFDEGKGDYGSVQSEAQRIIDGVSVPVTTMTLYDSKHEFHLWQSASQGTHYFDIGYAGKPVANIPQEGIDTYYGLAMAMVSYTQDGVQQASTPYPLPGMKAKVNWQVGKVLVRSGLGDVFGWGEEVAGPLLFTIADIGSASSGSLTNVTVFGTPGYADTINSLDGTNGSGTWYGGSAQGLAVSVSGKLSDLAQTDLSSPQGQYTMLGGLIKEPKSPETAAAGVAHYQGFVSGVAEDMTNIDQGRQTFVNATPEDFALDLNFDKGTASGTLKAKDSSVDNATTLASTSPGVITYGSGVSLDLTLGGSSAPSAVIDAQTLATGMNAGQSTVTTGEATTSLKASSSNYVVSAATQPSDFATWGYWEAAWNDPETYAPYHLHQPGSYWVAGELTPQAKIAALQQDHAQGNYDGTAMGVRISDGPSPQVLKLPDGTVALAVDFGTTNLNNAVTGTITFPGDTAKAYKGQTLTIGSSHSTPVSSSGNGFTASVTNAQSSAVHGAFYGPSAQAIGGNFQAKMNDGRYQGIFVGNKK